MKTLACVFTITAIFICSYAFSQQGAKVAEEGSDIKKANVKTIDSLRQADIIDILIKIWDKKTSPDKRKVPAKANFSIIPYAGYTLSTGFTVDVSGNVGFFTYASHNENYSVLAADISYDSKKQKTFLTRSEIWTKNNNYKFVTDLRLQRYPTATYGLGSSTTFATADDIDFSYIRAYETVLRKLSSDLYCGIGYNLDYHYDISATGNLNGTISDFMKYGQPGSSTSSGLNLTLLYDNRKNSLNPSNGFYLNVIYRDNLTGLGSGANWQSFQLDLRRYIRLSSNSNNVLAFWSIVGFSNGNVPYLDLPASGSDMYNNSGRGYAVGRFRGRDMLYLESEYRFGITGNGLLGAVIFANGQSFTGLQNNTFQKIAPAAGTGLRIKINKHSNANICIDYGVGTGGSHGFFVNLGEVF